MPAYWLTSRAVMTMLRARWKLVLVSEIYRGGRRYQDLHDARDGIFCKVLTETIRRAERDGLVVRHLDGGRIETATLYELTDLGRSLDVPLAAMTRVVASESCRRVGIAAPAFHPRCPASLTRRHRPIPSPRRASVANPLVAHAPRSNGTLRACLTWICMRGRGQAEARRSRARRLAPVANANAGDIVCASRRVRAVVLVGFANAVT
jgi:DNA-binding HxlR family transcriptional regulator